MPSELEILRAQVKLMRECHEEADQVLRSAMSIAERDGMETNWPAFRAKLRFVLDTYYVAARARCVMEPSKVKPLSERLRERAAEIREGDNAEPYEFEEMADEIELLEKLRDGREVILPHTKQHAEQLLLIAEASLKSFNR